MGLCTKWRGAGQPQDPKLEALNPRVLNGNGPKSPIKASKTMDFGFVRTPGPLLTIICTVPATKVPTERDKTDRTRSPARYSRGTHRRI